MTKARTNADNASADIQGVTAGTGITGGGTSGTVTITNDMATTIDAKGDLLVGTGADTYDNLAAGDSGSTLVADSAESTGLRWQGNYAAGKNKIINGDMSIWQRGTSITLPQNVVTYTADRMVCFNNGTGTVTVTQQSFTPGTAPVAGYENQFFARVDVSTVGTTTSVAFTQRIEDVRTFAGQTITLSFWAKASASQVLSIQVQQVFGSGGSTSLTTSAGSVTLTSSWERYTKTISVPSISGKTIGPNSFLSARLDDLSPEVGTIDIWGLQVEAGSVATAFQTATGNPASELAACQRYLPAISGQYNQIWGIAFSTTGTAVTVKLPQTARVKPTGITVSAVGDFTLRNSGFTSGTPTAIVFNQSGTDFATLSVTTTAGSPTIAKNEPIQFEWSTANSLILFTGCEL